MNGALLRGLPTTDILRGITNYLRLGRNKNVSISEASVRGRGSVGNGREFHVGRGGEEAGQEYGNTKVQGNEHMAEELSLKNHGFEPFNLFKE